MNSYVQRSAGRTNAQVGAFHRMVRRLRNRFRRSAVILMYHRVTDLERDSYKLAVSTHHFREHIAVLSREFRPVSLQSLCNDLQHGKTARRSVVVTFDDGYADNDTYARPILEQHGVPATIFAVSGHIGVKTPFWWDRLEQILMGRLYLPKSLDFFAGSETLRFELDEDARWDVFPERRWPGWSLFDQHDPTRRHSLFRKLHGILKRLPPDERETGVGFLEHWAGGALPSNTANLAMSADQARAAVAGGLIEIGAHSAGHAALASMPPAVQRQEIVGCKRDLESLLGREVKSFSYPFGFRPEHYTDETVQIVREAGFACACAGNAGLIWPASRPFELPRHVVFDQDGDAFARQLRTWFAA